MKRVKSVTAEELVARLASDSKYQAALAAQRQRAMEIQVAEEPILRALSAAGYPGEAIEDIVRRHTPLSAGLCQILLDFLQRTGELRIQETIVRSLALTATPFDVRPLIDLFEQTSSASLRWAIANTLAELRPLDARDWVIAALDRVEYGRAREMLPLALARIATTRVANEVLLRHLDELPAHVALGLAESGGAAEVNALKRKAQTEKGWVRKEIERAIRKIEKRRTHE